MADSKISELIALAAVDLAASDEVAIVDDSAAETRRMAAKDLVGAGFDLYTGDGNAVSFDATQTFPKIPANSKTAAYTLLASDAGKHISITTGGVTVDASVFAVGDVVSIYNNSGSNQTITQGAGVTLRNAGTSDTGNRTLAQYGIATLLCVASDEFIIAGVGLS